MLILRLNNRKLLKACTETEVVNNNSGIEIDCELHSSHVELVKPRDVDLQHLGADFVLNMLTEQKLTQINVQYVMEAATTLINEAFKYCFSLWEICFHL
ncbi:hypothetical protein OUZ56_012424 [Daphnia magna]|uniref:Uncharacterized protein n=1 Tax=Daphnia magna TaxID=35525 RepID=A0ABQ9Z328_9CRUS|nr:hypothetical protein OUZ56_012424 [Daphnia magna]